MRNGFGLRFLHKFLSLPFLQLQRETLTALLNRNKKDTEVCSLELAEYLVSDLFDRTFDIALLLSQDCVIGILFLNISSYIHTSCHWVIGNESSLLRSCLFF